MGIPFLPYPAGVSVPVPGPGSIFLDGILDIPGVMVPAQEAGVELQEDGKPRVRWPSITSVYKFSFAWTYTSRTLAEGIISEFSSLGLNGFDYVYPADKRTYRCFWVDSPDIHPIDYTESWVVKAELLGIRIG